MQQLRSRLIAQFARPEGVWGSVAGAIMARRRSNRHRNAWVVELLNLEPDARVLEIGFGPGIGLERALALAPHGRIYGVDHSPVMLAQAARRNHEAMAAGRLELFLSPVEHIPDAACALTHIFTVNSALFWKTPEDTLRLLQHRLVPGGILAIGHQPRGTASGATEAIRQGRHYEQMLTETGYAKVRVELTQFGSDTIVCVRGRRPPAFGERLLLPDPARPSPDGHTDAARGRPARDARVAP